ncbi:hypothetical protein CLIB1423_06S05138 [[Candida] railenensis]|uniref:Uncharacterized protein n=1 Tax=[Candida] railenensis TaxID=45579 RepID=A0A9P0QPA5_9ASCO|nr:hypothetical protein CLIB1423_06S05138 [[Candida] railenensis]
MKAIAFDKGDFSYKQFFASGLKVHVYNAESIKPYLETFKNAGSLKQLKHNNIPINVAYLIHPRDDDYTFTESIAYNLLSQYYAKRGSGASTTPLVCVTFDIPNHGSRVIDKQINQTWGEGNETHGQDMISIIDTTVEEIKLLMDSIPTYLNPEYDLAKSARLVRGYENTGIDYFNIISGYSLGAHVSIRFAAKYPTSTHIINPVCGCSDLTSLLLNRLHRTDKSDDLQKKMFYYSYEELKNLSDDDKLKFYPESLHKHISEQDTKIFENLSSSKIKIFAAFGSADDVVPPSISSLWIDMCKINNHSSRSFTQEGIKHDVTEEMVDNFTSWLVEEAP